MRELIVMMYHRDKIDTTADPRRSNNDLVE